MALSETDNSDCNSDSSVDGNTNKERKEKHLTKIVVRRLPPSMNKETFLNQVSPLPDYDYMYFVRADMSLGEYAYSRAYINFKNATDIFIFKEKFDNYVFLDSKGNEYAAVVEFAPFSRIPKKRNKRPDPKCGTIESDPIYTEFVESLNEVTTENEEKPEYCFQPSVDDKKEITNTPLLDYVKQRRIDRQKLKEEKREERKRRELERKRVKDDERKIREKSYSSSTRKQPFKSTSLNVIDEGKSDATNLKLKERSKPDEYKNKTGSKPSNFREREYPDKKTSYVSSKSIHSSGAVDRKPPPKMRQRSTSYQEKEPRRSEYKSTRREDAKYRKDEPDEKVMEKKVKKYSERREERKNEIKKTETKPDADSTKDDKNETKCDGDNKCETNKECVKEAEKKFETRENNRSRDSESRESTRSRDNESRESTRSRENDPRTQRRIRNKDRPAMQIYQPGMLKNRNKCSDTNQDEKNSNVLEDEQKTD